LTTDSAGHQQGPLRNYTPFGDPITPTGTVDPDADPDTQPGQSDYGWLGQHQRPHDHAGTLNLIQMGARPYTPQLGRFLAVDPVEGGSANNYDYTNADPTNTTDLDGKAPWRCRWTCWSPYKIVTQTTY
jgi:RHS repeat-associated protein